MQADNAAVLFATARIYSSLPFREGFQKKKQQNLRHLSKRGGWGQNFVQTKILLKIVTRGHYSELAKNVAAHFQKNFSAKLGKKT